jgi:hypothetical protein
MPDTVAGLVARLVFVACVLPVPVLQRICAAVEAEHDEPDQPRVDVGQMNPDAGREQG